MTPSVLIVGAGIIGAMTAWRLARTGVEVTLIDEDRAERNASEGSLAWLNVSSTTDDDYARLRAESLGLWRRLAAERPDAPIARIGTLLWFGDDRDLTPEAAWLTARGVAAEAIGPEAFRALAPGVARPPACAIHAPEEGAADPRRITAWALNQAKAAGAARLSATVAAILTSSGAATGLRLGDGTALQADHVILAAGAGGAALLAPLGVEIPLRHAPGATSVTTPAPRLAGPVLATPDLDFWQAADGRILIGTGPEATLATGEAGPGGHALSALQKLIPAAADLRIERTVRRERPIPRDGFPALGAPAGLDRLFVALTHSGMTLAPIIAEMAAGSLEGRKAPTIWRPDRDYDADLHGRRA